MASAAAVPEVALRSGNGGRPMPAIGMGTAGMGTATRDAVLAGLEVGFRHFDTASMYGSEQPLGEAVTEAVQRGLVAAREEVFITSKLWSTRCHPHLVLPSLRESLHVMAHSPLGGQSCSETEGNAVLQSEVLAEIAKARGKSIAQVALRWIYEQGASPIVKSFSKERLKENIEIFL